MSKLVIEATDYIWLCCMIYPCENSALTIENSKKKAYINKGCMLTDKVVCNAFNPLFFVFGNIFSDKNSGNIFFGFVPIAMVMSQ